MQALPKRQSTLVRPERQRFDNHHPQYYSSLRAIYDDNNEVDNNKDLLFMDQKEIHGIITRDTDSDITNLSSNHSIKSSSIHLWKVYCYLMTCCFPPFLLGCFGKKDKTAQYAFREKIGLVSIIFYIMAGVGFLTFGFTQTVCSTPPLSFKIDELDHGHIIIHGQAYPFTSWHHPSPFNQPMVDIIGSYGGGKGSGVKDASFLFQNINQRCMNIITSKKDHVPIGSQEFPTYFPCHLFDNTNQPDPSTYQNQTGCHVTTYARLELDRLKYNGIPNAKNRLDKVGRVYYDWSDINSTNHLTVFNSNVLNLKLLFSLPLNLFNIPANGLIETAIKNPSFFGGKDISRVVVSRSHLATTTTTNNNNNNSNNSNINWLQEAYCLLDIIKVGEIDTKSVGCIASDIVLYTSLLVILGTIFVKFILAVLFGWCLSWKLGHFKEGRSYKERMKREKEIENWTTSINQPADMIRPRVYSPKPKPPLFLSSKINLMPKTSRFTPPETGSKHYKPAGSVQFERPGSSPLWKHSSSVHTLGQFNSSLSQLTDLGRCTPAFSEMASLKRFSEMTMPNSKRSSLSSHTNFTTTGLSSSASTMQCPYSLHPFAVHQPLPDFMPFGFPLIHTVCLVTCYSEGEEGLRTTLDSIATTDYPNSHKLILVIADGDIVGHGNSKSTPDICISMMEDLLVPKHQVQPHSYVAIADGKKRHNMARIYAGFYHYDRRTVDRSQRKRVPMITIVKCGTPEERQQEKKPGNRGKRDSQVILMSFLQKVMFDERMTRLEYELFTNIWRVAGICPDAYEIVLMVDADTKIYPDSLSRMVSCMASDDQIAGLCGETKIGNKTDSWVSMIQVFEYYISHHQSKAFESIFGNVTCLPGCFCMYRIKAPKGNNGHWVPILANPDVIEHYSENVVDTLHKKNLLLLGEDRYLSTLMLKTFPHRKMLFVPQAVCKTVVPDTFSVLLSQRRRWINSTIHNLMELLFVNDLCGTFCFSMQFVVFMELVGTLTLPAAISFTIYLIILALLGQPALASLLLLALILGLPAILIVMTSRKLVYVIWMLIYLISLPIWNFVLPTYAYWHFDDFTWGETRKVQGEDDIKKESSNQHGEKDGVFDSSKIIMKKWCDYEKDRRLLEV